MKRFKSFLLTEMPQLMFDTLYRGRVGDEARLDNHIGEKDRKISSLKNYTIHSDSPKKNIGNATIYAKHKDTGKVHMHVDLCNGHACSLHAHKDSEIKAHEFYHHLVTHHGIKLKSDTNQSVGAMKTWKKLSEYPDVKVTHQKFDSTFIDSKTKSKTLPLKKDFKKNYGDSSTYFKAVKK